MRFDLNEDHMARFQKAVRREISAFGLTDWLIDFEWIEDPEEEALAQVRTVVSNRSALFQLNKTWTDDPIPRRIERVAYHEVLEVLLNPICAIARLNQEDVSPSGKEYLLAMERHAIIRRLENLYMGDWQC